MSAKSVRAALILEHRSAAPTNHQPPPTMQTPGLGFQLSTFNRGAGATFGCGGAALWEHRRRALEDETSDSTRLVELEERAAERP